MDDLFDNYKIEFDLSVRLPIYDECLHYVNTIDGKIYNFNDDENDYEECGLFLAYLVNLNQILEDGRNRFDMLDAYSGELLQVSEIYGTKCHIKRGYFTKAAFDALEIESEIFCSSEKNFIYVDRLEIIAEHRGKGVGLYILNQTLSYLAKAMQVEFFVLIPAPLQHTYGVFDEDAELDDWKKKLALHNLEKERPAALKKLKQLYAEIGFKSVKGTDLMVCDACDFYE